MKPKVERSIFNGEDALYLKAGPYEAIILPLLGGNLVSFRHQDKGYRFLREPNEKEMPLFKEKPIKHGIPVLFPANRVDRGKFLFDGQHYSLPINEPALQNHLHGFFYNRSWELLKYGTMEKTAYVTVQTELTETEPDFLYFPHPFQIQINYTLSENGLIQETRIMNLGVDCMPIMLGFHTTFQVPFDPKCSKEDYIFQLPVCGRWELSDRLLPTGSLIPLSEQEKMMSEQGINPFYCNLNHHYFAKSAHINNRMELRDQRNKATLIYETDISFKHWMVFNDFCQGEYVCVEPQTNMVNAPNVPLPDEVTGLIRLNPKENWKTTCRMVYVQN